MRSWNRSVFIGQWQLDYRWSSLITSASQDTSCRIGGMSIRSVASKCVMQCDNSGLTQCLNLEYHVFSECSKMCKTGSSVDPAGYNDCQTECRDIRDQGQQKCHSLHCAN
jgi:hypothetical protein